MCHQGRVCWLVLPGVHKCSRSGEGILCVANLNSRETLSLPSESGIVVPLLTSRGGGPQWVRFASLRLAPAAPATTAFIAVSSMCSFCPLARSLFRVSFGFMCCTRSASAGGSETRINPLCPALLLVCRCMLGLCCAITPDGEPPLHHHVWHVWAVPPPGQGRQCWSMIIRGLTWRW